MSFTAEEIKTLGLEGMVQGDAEVFDIEDLLQINIHEDGSVSAKATEENGHTLPEIEFDKRYGKEEA